MIAEQEHCCKSQETFTVEQADALCTVTVIIFITDYPCTQTPF